ncbi:MAG: HEAT repeat domain-containing protein [Nitrospirae bacterium]|nr:MAG: HEAT repeat domain-containing protein [Nitrospirota bacterium]
MGRKKTEGGREVRRNILLFSTIFVALINMSNASQISYYEESLPKWLDLLVKGNRIERKLALDNLTFLQFAEYRKDIKVFDPILAALKDEDPSIREAAAGCLKSIGEYIQETVDDNVWSQNCCKNTMIVPALIKVLQEDKTPRVRAEAAKALGMYRSDRKGYGILDREERAIDPLINALKDVDPWVRLYAAFSLGELRAQKAGEPLRALLEDNSDWRNIFVQQEAFAAIRKIGMRGTGAVMN